MTLDLEPARNSAVTQLQAEYESAVCAVDGQEKWPLHPFCRDCSIKLQRANMMQPLNGIVAATGMVSKFGERGRNWMYWGERWRVEAYARYYDICRDFLIVTKRIPMHRKIQDLD